MLSNRNPSDGDADSRRPPLWRPLIPILLTVIWGVVAGVLMPLLVGRFTPKVSCDDLYLPRLPIGGWPFVFFFFFRWVEVFVGLLFLVWAFSVRPVWLAWLHGVLVVGVTAWVFVVSTFVAWLYIDAPQVHGQVVVEDQQYVLAFCMDFQLEGGDAALYRCEEAEMRSCYRLTGGLVGMTQEPTLRYEDGSLIVDDMLWEPLVYPLDGGE